MKTEDVKKLSPEERLLYWINERESIRRKKTLGLPAPWTDDEILQTYRFTCVRRMDDKVSDWLLRNWYRPYKDHPNMLVAAAMARFINLPSSLKLITAGILAKGAPEWPWVKSVLREAKKDGPIFNGAYMVRNDPGIDKIEYTVKVVSSLQQTGLVNSFSMEETWAALNSVYGFGSFMAGQVVADLRWAMSGAWSDRKTWAAVGPGSRRGMNRLKERSAESPLGQEQFTEELQEMMEWLEPRLSRDLTKRLEAVDYQSCLCELDKYTRVLLGEGRPKQLYKGVL